MKSYTLIAVIAAGCGSFGLAQAAIDVATGFPVNVDPAATRNAQLAGLNAPYGSFDGNVGFAAWEFFKGTGFSNIGAQYTGGSHGLNASLSHTGTGNVGVSGSAIEVGGETYNGRLANGPYNFSIDAIAQKTVTSITLQIKHTPFLDSDWVAQLAFDPTLTFGGNTLGYTSIEKSADSYGFADPGSSVFAHIYSYTWEGVAIEAGEAFSLDFSSIADQLGFGFSIDTVALHVVPEPSTYALLLGVGVAAVAVARRRRALAA